MTFEAFLERQPLDRYEAASLAATRADVEACLARRAWGFDDYLTLLSPSARHCLEPLAQRARDITRTRFGRVVQMYAPLYVSNVCTNSCVYCGFSRVNRVRRATLSTQEVDEEARILHGRGFRSLLLVSGEAPRTAPVAYFEELARRLHPRFPSLSIEIYPLDRRSYERLVGVGVEGLTLYQETYDRARYRTVHPRGPKSDYAWRLEAPGRGAAAGMRRVGLGALLGLGPWRREAIALGLHALWLQQEHWQAQVSVSFPRLRHAAGGFVAPAPVSDAELVQMACALRLLLPDAGLTLSTRESAPFRDGLAQVCVTHLSAGSCTEPGGYGRPGGAQAQFAVEDARSPADVAARLLELGLEPVWKDWDTAFTGGGLRDDGVAPHALLEEASCS